MKLQSISILIFAALLTACGTQMGDSASGVKPVIQTPIHRPTESSLSQSALEALLNGTAFFQYERGMYIITHDENTESEDAVTCNSVTQTREVLLKVDANWIYTLTEENSNGALERTPVLRCSTEPKITYHVDKTAILKNVKDLQTMLSVPNLTFFYSDHTLKIYGESSSDTSSFQMISTFDDPEHNSVFIGLTSSSFQTSNTNSPAPPALTSATTSSSSSVSKRTSFGKNLPLERVRPFLKDVSYCYPLGPEAKAPDTAATIHCEEHQDLTSMILN